MGISVIGAAASSGGGGSSNFSVNMADYANNTAELSREYPTGSYSITTDPTDSTIDIYFVTSDGSLAGYSNTGAIIATAAFDKVVVLSSQASAKIAFAFGGESATVATSGQIVTAGAYLTSITPGDLATTDDTATVTGGNFASDVEVFFVSGGTEIAAKSIVRSNSTSLLITRPDVFDPALDPWTVKVSNPGIPVPSGGNSHLLVGAVDAGASPVWTTTSPLPAGFANSAYSTTVQATDADAGSTVVYSITAGTLPAGLALNSTTGEISGTPTAGGGPVTIQADDGNGNTNSRSFSIPVQLATGGSVTSANGYTMHSFTSSGTFTALADTTVEFLVIAGGAGGGSGLYSYGPKSGGGGGAGGYISSISGETSGEGSSLVSTITLSSGNSSTVTIGAAGSGGTNGSAGNSGTNSSFGSVTATGGGGGGGYSNPGSGNSGGSGGGGQTFGSGGSGTTGQGSNGRSGDYSTTAGGGGGSGTAWSGGTSGGRIGNASVASSNGALTYYASGGSGGYNGGSGSQGTGYGSGGGGANGPSGSGYYTNGGAGLQGIVIVRYAS